MYNLSIVFERSDYIEKWSIRDNGINEVGHIFLEVQIGILFVSEIYTRPEFRKQGIGSWMIERIIQYSRNLHIWEVVLQVVPYGDSDMSLIELENFYIKRGFSVNAEYPSCFSYKVMTFPKP